MKKPLFLILALMFVLGLIAVKTVKNANQRAIVPIPNSSWPETAAFSPECTGTGTVSQTEGTYYKIGSPQRNNIANGLTGEKLTVAGFVFDKNCQQIANAWLDFWQADSTGVYDNQGFTLRGHQFTDTTGKYTFETIVPKDYESRPPHIHVKVRAGNGPILTSQLYFPNAAQNKTDNIFNAALVMDVQNTESGKRATFNFVLP